MAKSTNEQLLELFRAELKYTSELWTVLQEVRLWAALKDLELPSCAKPNHEFFYERFDEIHARHTEMEKLLSGEVGGRHV